MNYILIGAIIGLVMGLSGSGGALVSIPLFMTYMNLGLKEASVLSLFAVILAAGINFVGVARKAALNVSLVMSLASFIGSYATIPLKVTMPEIIIAILIGGISLFGLVSVWRSASEVTGHETPLSVFWASLSGLVLGAMTTLTGIGGGVLLMPVLLGLFKFGQSKAVATSLLIITLSSGASLLMQVMKGFPVPEPKSLTLLTAGILVAAVTLKYATRFIDSTYLVVGRKVVLSIVVALALLKIF